jgi:hypothetical protein
MPRVRQNDTPEYAVDVIDGARPVGSQLAIAAGILTVLMSAMSLAEAPMLRQDVHINEAESTGSLAQDEPGFLCSIGGKVKDWVSVEAS